MPLSIENTMSQDIKTPIRFAAMQTYGARVKAARERVGLSQSQLGRAIGGLKQPSIHALEGRETKSKYTLDIARITGVRPEWLDNGTGPMLDDKSSVKTSPQVEQKLLTNADINVHEMVADVPVLGLASCGEDGLFELNGQEHDQVRRPKRLVGVKDAYALYVDGESMVPWRKPGQLVYVHPHQPAQIGDHVVVEMVPDGPGEPKRAYIKLLVRRTAEKLILHQYNPSEDKTLPMKRVRAVHRIIDWSELLGL